MLNGLLASLDGISLSAVEPHLEERFVVPGAVLFQAGEVLDAVYFPRAPILSIHERSGASAGIEVGLVGPEGMLGWSILLGCPSAAHTASVCMGEGSLLRLPAGPLLQACASVPRLSATLLRYVHVMTVQMSRSMVSHLHDPVLRRLSRWLLMRHDRVSGDELTVRHDEIGTSLDVRRASITDGLHILEGDQLIRCHRGRILIRDRNALELLAGDAYGSPEARYRDLIGPFGKTGPASSMVNGPSPAPACASVG